MKAQGGPIDGLVIPESTPINEGQVHVIHLKKGDQPLGAACYVVVNGELVYSQEKTSELTTEDTGIDEQETDETTPEEDADDETGREILGRMKVAIDTLEAQSLVTRAETLNLELKLTMAAEGNPEMVLKELHQNHYELSKKLEEIKEGFQRMNNYNYGQ